jgi:hypothetical protein
MSRPLSPIVELSALIAPATAALRRFSSSMGFPIVAIDETFMTVAGVLKQV